MMKTSKTQASKREWISSGIALISGVVAAVIIQAVVSGFAYG